MDTQILIEKYKKLVEVTAKIDYSDNKSVSSNNKAVTEMYKIAVDLDKNYPDGMEKFSTLLKIDQNKTNEWAAFNIMNSMSPTLELKKECLNIIEKAALDEDNYGYKLWLKDYYKENSDMSIFSNLPATKEKWWNKLYITQQFYRIWVYFFMKLFVGKDNLKED